MVHDREFFVDLIALPFHEFDLILGMDWLSKHRAIVDCDKKTVLLKCSDMSEVTIHGIRSDLVSKCKLDVFLEKVVKPFWLWYLTLREDR